LRTALVDVLRQLDFNYAGARKMFVSMLRKRDQWLRHVLNEDFEQMRWYFEQNWNELVDAKVAELATLFSSADISEFIELGQYAAERAENTKSKALLSAFNDQTKDSSVADFTLSTWHALSHLLLTDKGTLRKTINKNVGFPTNTKDEKAVKARMTALLDSFADDEQITAALFEANSFPDPDFSDAAWHHMTSLVVVLKALAALLQLVFRRHNEVDYSEIAQRANLALASANQVGELESTDLAMKLDHQIRHILVDEFQDTSYSQIELLKKLTSAWERHESDVNQGNTLFLVGDPMQSIYRFRDAEVGLFLRVFGSLEAPTPQSGLNSVFENLRLQSLRLSENFRSDATLVGEFNALFNASFPDRSDLVNSKISYSEATAGLSGSSNSKRTSSHQFTHTTADFYTDKTEEAEGVVERCQQFLQQHPISESGKLSDKDKLAILVRSRSQLKPIIEVLNQQKIGFVGLDLVALDKTQSVIDLINLTKALYRPADRVAWFGLCRGPWVGLTLEQLQRLSSNEKSIWQNLNEQDESQLLACEQSISLERLQNVKQVISSALEQRYSTPVASLVRWCWQSLGADQILSKDELQDMEQIFDLLTQFDVAGDLINFEGLQQNISKLYASTANAADSQIVLSTIHKAKGLEYHTVILPCLERKGPNSEKEVLLWLETVGNQGEAKLLMAPYLRASEKQNNGHYDFLRGIERERQHNELIRLMYVACTRARKKLILSCSGKVSEDGETLSKPISGSLLLPFWDFLEKSFYQSMAGKLNLEQNADGQDNELGRQASPNLLHRINTSEVKFPEPINWQARYQIAMDESDSDDNQQDQLDESSDGQQPDIHYDWAGSVSKAVGIVFHDWLQFADAPPLQARQMLEQNGYWVAALKSAGLADARIRYALNRIRQGLRHIADSQDAAFIFAEHNFAQNECALSAYRDGQVRRYRIDRTFIQELNGETTRWIIDYKTTVTEQDDIDKFVDEQIRERHLTQLNQYAQLMSQLDPDTPIELALYFPMLGKFRHWRYIEEQ
jgi:ATP-dependent exoDNAse (exonuclease V) beta subunit